MKKISLTLLALGMFAMLPSCQKNAPEGPVDNSVYSVGVSLDGVFNGATKSADKTPTDKEKAFTDAYVLVFDADGNLESYKEYTGSSLMFSLTAGKKTIIAALNAGTDVVNTATLSAFRARTSSLADLDAKGFLMLGEKEVIITTSVDFSITVKRMAAKIVVDKFRVEFDSPLLAVKPVKLKGVYLINVSAKNAYDYSPSGEWVNKMKFETSACDAYAAATGLNMSITQGQDYALDKVFYAFPNPTEDDFHNGDWKARHTRIVFEVDVDGETYYYNKTFSSVVNNGLYSVNATKITKIGIDTPDGEMTSTGAGGEITIDDWTPAGDYDETL